MTKINRLKLESLLNRTFSDFNIDEDYSPNGLQIQGKEEIKLIAFAVSATKESISKSVLHHADCLIVHHGLFWNSSTAKPIIGSHYHRIAPLIKNEINLYAYHLPLDGHPEIGNAKVIADKLKLQHLTPFGSYRKTNTGISGTLSKPLTPVALYKKLEQLFERPIFHACASSKTIRTIGIITGGASNGWREAQKQGLDCFISGEMSEHDYHDAIEAGIHFYGCGHHQTERGGILALQSLIEKNLKVKTIFFDSETPA